jgi:DNA repair exonuclease SbcCD ATPase subunit
MYIEFGSIVITDFKAFKGRHALALNGEGVVYVVGENRVTKRLAGNGAAKSSIWDALCWCLYGRTPLGLRNNDVKPWDGGRPFVVVCLVIDGVEVLIQRSTNPNKFLINGEEKPDISSVLPMSFELFINTILLPQDKPLFFDRSPSDKMELIAEACYLNRWDARSEAAAKATSEKESDVELLMRELSLAEGALSEVEVLLEEERIKSKSWNDKASGHTQASKTDIDKLQRQFDAQDKHLSTAILAEDSALTEKRASEAQARKLRGELSTARGKVSSHEARLRVGEEQLAAFDEDLSVIARAKTCPVCNQPIKTADLASHKKHLQEQRGVVAAAMTKETGWLKTAKEDLQSIDKKLSRVETDSENFASKSNDAQDAVLRLKASTLELGTKLDAARRVKDDVNPHLAQVAALRDRQRAIKFEVADIKGDIITQQEALEQVRFWVKAFKDIKLQLIEEVLGELELAANSMIEEVGLEDWQVRLDIEKESKTGNIRRMINVQISSPESKEFVKWESWSGGERQRLKLIGSLSLADVLLGYVGIETNLEILDEPALYWSSEGVQELCAFLAERARERKKTIFYIEHNTVESTHFTETVRVIKDKSGAYIG